MLSYTRNKKRIRFESDKIYTGYTEAVEDIMEHLATEGVAYVVKSKGTADSPPIIEVDGAEYELQINQSQYFFPIQRVRITNIILERTD